MTRADWKDGERTRSVEVTPGGADGATRVVVDGVALDLAVETLGPGRLRFVSDRGATTADVTVVGDRCFVRLGALDFVFTRAPRGRKRGAASAGGSLEAPMPGVVTRVHVKPGDAVTRGQALVAVEAMKMEHVVRAPRDGRVARIAAVAGQLVNGGMALVELEDDGPA